jgi:hypothetical protein
MKSYKRGGNNSVKSAGDKKIKHKKSDGVSGQCLTARTGLTPDEQIMGQGLPKDVFGLGFSGPAFSAFSV